MKKEDIEGLKIFASTMDWDDLAHIIMEIEEELFILKGSLSRSELKDRNIELDIYEEAKVNLLKKHIKRQMKIHQEYGTNYVTTEDYEE